MEETTSDFKHLESKKTEKGENTLIYLGVVTFLLFSPLMVALMML